MKRSLRLDARERAETRNSISDPTRPSPRYTVGTVGVTLGVIVCLFANSNEYLKIFFYGIFILAVLAPHLFGLTKASRASLTTSAFVFVVYNLLVLMMHPLDRTALYNGAVGIACILLMLTFSMLSLDGRSVAGFVRQLSILGGILIPLVLVLRIVGVNYHWDTQTGMLWLLLFFVTVDPKRKWYTKGLLYGVWVLGAYLIDDRAYLMSPIIVGVVFLIWPVLCRHRFIAAVVTLFYFCVLAFTPLVYVWLSQSRFRESLDALAISYTGGRFFSGRDVIWSQMLREAIEGGIFFGVGHGAGAGQLFTHTVSAHNAYVSVLTRTGVVGLCVLFLVLLALILLYAKLGKSTPIRVAAAFTFAILFKQSTELSLLDNNVAFASLSWLVMSFGLIFANSRAVKNPVPTRSQ